MCCCTTHSISIINMINQKKIISEVCDILKQGGLVVVPSDTVYGLSVDATNQQAVENLIAFKSRPTGKPISVFVRSIKECEKIVAIDREQRKTLESILPGCYTVVLSSRHRINSLLESEKGTLGIRVVKHPFIQALTEAYPNPITATSANLSGGSPHYSIESLLKSLSAKKRAMIDYIVDYGKLPYNKPSTVIDLSSDEIEVIRQGDSTIALGEEYTSKSEQETKQIAKQIIQKFESGVRKKPLVIILQGELGAGKTQFVKGVGGYLGVHDIISPTFVIHYEYKIPKKGFNFLYHVDLYNVTEKSEFAHLGFENMLKPGNVICIEWGEKSGELQELLVKKANVVYIQIQYIDDKTRSMQMLLSI